MCLSVPTDWHSELRKDIRQDVDSDSGSESSSASGSDFEGNGKEGTDGKKEVFKFTVSATTMMGFQSAVEEGNDSLVRFYIIEYPTNNFLRTVWENGMMPCAPVANV